MALPPAAVPVSTTCSPICAAASRLSRKARLADFDGRKYHLLGTSGTVTTLAAIALKLPRYNRTRVDGSWHETAHMLKVVDRLVGLDIEALAKIGSIGPERADLMLPGCAIFAAICSLWPSPVLRVADRGLREGMLRRLSQT